MEGRKGRERGKGKRKGREKEGKGKGKEEGMSYYLQRTELEYERHHHRTFNNQ